MAVKTGFTLLQSLLFPNDSNHYYGDIMNEELFNIKLEDATRRESALGTILQQMDVPKLRQDTSEPANLRWLNRNLGINNGSHPLFATAAELTIWLLKWHQSR